MSIHAMTLVWEHYKRGGSEKLALLALADWCDDAGGSLHPSIATIARKICISEVQARRIVHGFISTGLLEVVGNRYGGNPMQTRRYRLKLDKLKTFTDTPLTDATPLMNATPNTDAHHPSHRCAQPLSPVRAKPPGTTKEPSTPQRNANPANGYPANASRPAQGSFDAFWSAYPNKKSRGDAERAWKALRPDAGLLEAVLQAIERARSSPQWRQDSGKYIPHPATWLRGKRWMDEDTGAGAAGDAAIPVWER